MTKNALVRLAWCLFITAAFLACIVSPDPAGADASAPTLGEPVALPPVCPLSPGWNLVVVDGLAGCEGRTVWVYVE